MRVSVFPFQRTGYSTAREHTSRCATTSGLERRWLRGQAAAVARDGWRAPASPSAILVSARYAQRIATDRTVRVCTVCICPSVCLMYAHGLLCDLHVVNKVEAATLKAEDADGGEEDEDEDFA